MNPDQSGQQPPSQPPEPMPAANHFFIRFRLTFGSVIFRRNKFVMLCRNHYGLYTCGCTVVVIFHSNLTFTIGTKISHHFAFSSDCSQFNKQIVSNLNAERHQIFGFSNRITEHHSLITRSLIIGIFAFYSAINITRLSVNRR